MKHFNTKRLAAFVLVAACCAPACGDDNAELLDSLVAHNQSTFNQIKSVSYRMTITENRRGVQTPLQREAQVIIRGQDLWFSAEVWLDRKKRTTTGILNQKYFAHRGFNSTTHILGYPRSEDGRFAPAGRAELGSFRPPELLLAAFGESYLPLSQSYKASWHPAEQPKPVVTQREPASAGLYDVSIYSQRVKDGPSLVVTFDATKGYAITERRVFAEGNKLLARLSLSLEKDPKTGVWFPHALEETNHRNGAAVSKRVCKVTQCQFNDKFPDSQFDLSVFKPAPGERILVRRPDDSVDPMPYVYVGNELIPDATYRSMTAGQNNTRPAQSAIGRSISTIDGSKQPLTYLLAATALVAVVSAWTWYRYRRTQRAAFKTGR